MSGANQRKQRDAELRDHLIRVKREGIGSQDAVRELFEFAQPLIRSWINKTGARYSSDDVFAETHLLVLEKIQETPEDKLSVRTVATAAVTASRHYVRERSTPLSVSSDSTFVKVKGALTKFEDDTKSAQEHLQKTEKITYGTFWAIRDAFTGGSVEDWSQKSVNRYADNYVRPNYDKIDRVQLVIGKMEDPHRTVLELREGIGGMEPYTFREIAEQLGISETSARNYHGTARNKFERLYTELFGPLM